MKYTQAKKAEYEARWARMVITKKAQAEKVRDLILRGRERYMGIQKLTGVPWEFVGLTHYRECACNWKGVLHNGQLIIGTGRKTTIVPKGYGPFDTWEAAALSALKRQGLDKETDWSVGRMAYLLEGFNGYGYQNKGIPSPYLWGGSNQYIRGKYVADHVFDPNHVDTQMGCMPVLRLLQSSQSHPVPAEPTTSPTPQTRPPAPPKRPPMKEGTAISLWSGAMLWLHEHRIELIVLGVLLLSAYVGWRYIRNRRLSVTSPKAGPEVLVELVQQEQTDQSLEAPVVDTKEEQKNTGTEGAPELTSVSGEDTQEQKHTSDPKVDDSK
jgi:lysozyme family protein